ncbi:MAG: HAMP domain-containing sensor histidine kinase [Rikenellaceae bacterium]
MRFINNIMLRVVLSLSIVLGVWAVVFYYTIVDEVNDETDDVLEDYATMIIQDFLSGEPMPSNDNGSNNRYYLRAVPPDSLSIVKGNEGFVNENIYIKYKGEDEPARVLRQVFRDAEDYYFEVTVITPTIDSGDLINAIWRLLVLLSLLLLLVLLLINTLAIRDGLKPLDRFMTWLNKSNVESCIIPTVESSNIREIKELTAAVERFAERGRRAFDEQKEFISNASHELQTPIAICQSRLELLYETPLSEQQMDDVAGCLSTLSRLSRLNKSLLMLSKIENGGFESTQVNINDLVAGNVEVLEELYQHRNISLTIESQALCTINCNRDLASTMVLNLLKNSYLHNVDGGEILIDIERNTLRIANSGEGNGLDHKKIFNRFYQGGSKSGSSGLGLSIVHSICKLYEFNITYTFADDRHIFEIKFR